MGKKLITVGNYRDYISDDKLFVTSDIIVTPGAKDKIRAEGIELVYRETAKCCSVEKKCDSESTKLDEKIIELLVKDFNITDPEVIRRLLSKVKELI